MRRLAVLYGSSALGPGGEEVAGAIAESGALGIQRHGESGYTLPHAIDHAANMRRAAEAGCDRVLAVCSVGSLRREIAVGSLLCPHDFIALSTTVTALGDARAHIAAGLAPQWRSRLLGTWAGAGELRDGGVYWQTNGPRFETPAEIRLIAAHADVVGMTLGAECAVACELGLSYAAVCAVDNLANGLAEEPLSVDRLEADRAANATRLRDGLLATLPELAA